MHADHDTQDGDQTEPYAPLLTNLGLNWPLFYTRNVQTTSELKRFALAIYW